MTDYNDMPDVDMIGETAETAEKAKSEPDLDLKNLSDEDFDAIILIAEEAHSARLYSNQEKGMTEDEASDEAYEWAIEHYDLEKLRDEERERRDKRKEEDNIPPCGNPGCDTNCSYCFPFSWDLSDEI
jgi:hypothetical protein